MELALSLIVVVAFVALFVLILGGARVLEADFREFLDRTEELAGRGGEGATPEIDARLRDLEDAVDRLPSKWADIQREAKNFYQRATHHVRRARSELADSGYRDPELEVIHGDLHGVDAGGSGGEGVPPVHQHMETDQPPQPEDWQAATLRRKYGAQ